MSQKTEIVTAISTLGCAIGIGFIMQSGDVADLRYGSGELLEVNTTAMVGRPANIARSSDVFAFRHFSSIDAQSITLTSADITTPPVPDMNALLVEASVSSASELRVTSDVKPAKAELAAPACPVSATAEPHAAAMVAYELSAPCLGGAPVVVRHSGLVFSEMLSPSGTLRVTIPALSENARIVATFDSGKRVTAEVTIDSVPLYNRVVVQWQGETGVQLHAREFGAQYGQEGHIWSGAARDFSAVAGGQGGFLTVLGDRTIQSAGIAEVYTFPSGMNKSQGGVDLTIETEVTQTNCAQEIRAQTLEFNAGKRISSQDMSLSVPDCDAIGNFLVLNNLVQDLTVASK